MAPPRLLCRRGRRIWPLGELLRKVDRAIPLGLVDHAPVGRLRLLEPIEVIDQIPLVELSAQPRGRYGAVEWRRQLGVRRNAKGEAVLDDGMTRRVEVQAAARASGAR